MRNALVSLTLAAALSTGCYHSVTHAGQPSGARQERVAWNLFWGIVDASFDVNECKTGVAYLDAWQPWWGFIPAWLTLGILSPQKIEYACAEGPQPAYPAYPPPGYPPPAAAPPPR